MAIFYGIGVGPGDPELLTIKAVHAIGTVDVLLVPETRKGKKGVAHQIIETYIRPQTEVVPLHFPMVTAEEVVAQAGRAAAETVTGYIRQGKNVGFVTLGDPGIYSTYGYIIKYLPKEVTVCTIPGITSFCAAGAAANQMLVQKNEILAVIPMHADPQQTEGILEAGSSFVFMKVSGNEPELLQMVERHQMEQSSVFVKKCGFEDCQINTNIKEALENNEEYLALLLSRKEA